MENDFLFNNIIIIALAICIFTMRASGPLLMKYVTLTPRRETMLNTMAIAILVALVANTAASGNLDVITAIIVTFLLLCVINNIFVAIITSMALAAFWPYLSQLF